MKSRRLIVYGLAGSLVCMELAAREVNQARAHFNYQMFCQGCHTADGGGVRAVPPLKNFVGIFLGSQQGREFLVRVPGVATSSLEDCELAEVLNYILLEFAGASLNADFKRYTAAEVAALRRQPLLEVNVHRARVLGRIASAERHKPP